MHVMSALLSSCDSGGLITGNPARDKEIVRLASFAETQKKIVAEIIDASFGFNFNASFDSRALPQPRRIDK